MCYLKKELSPYTKRAYVVGGSIRDILLGIEANDLDIEVYDIKPQKFEAMMHRIGAKGAGKSFFVYKYNNIDISLPRVEKKVGIGHRAFDVEVVNDEKTASRRRDFTMNALMYNIFEDKLLDYWQGLKDIENKTIKIIDEKSFKEDSLRVLRAMRFSAKLGFKCEKNSVNIMRKMDLDDLSKERIFMEFEKFFSTKYLHYGLYYLSKLLIIDKILNLSLDYHSFIKSEKVIIKYKDNFEKDIYKYYFLYILSKTNGWDMFDILKKINAPREYEKFYKLQPKFNGCDDKTILETALHIPVKMWLENYRPCIKKRAEELGVFDKKLKTSVKAVDVIRDGFKNEEISREISRREKEYILSIINHQAVF